MDNLELRQRITRSMIRVAERTQNMRRPGSYGVAAIVERTRQGVSHAGHYFDIKGVRTWKQQTGPPFWSEYTRGRTC